MKFYRSRKLWITISAIIFLLLMAVWAFSFFSYLKKHSGVEEKTILDCQDIGGSAFLVKEGEGEKIIKGKSDGIRIEIPNDWREMGESNEKELDFFDPSAKFNNPVENAKAGSCAMAIQFLKCNKITEFLTYADQVRIEIGSIKEKGIKDNQEEEPKKELFVVGQREGVKYIYEKSGKIKNIRISIPMNNSVYNFDSGIIFNEKCQDKFNGIMETLSFE